MKIEEFCTYAPKSGIKAGDAVKDGEYMFFTSSEDESKRYSSYQFDGEGIIMGTGGNATLHYYCGKYAVSTDCIVLLPDCRVKCKYLYYFFLANMPLLEAGFKGAGLKHTNKNYINSIEIKTIPSLEEQNRVIEVVDRLNDIICMRRKELSELDDLIKARFVELFGDCRLNPKGWKTVPLGNIAEVGSSKRVFVEELKESGIPFYRGTEVGALAEGKKVIPELYITDEHYDELVKATGKPEPGDLLMPSICPDGRIWVVDTDEPFYFKDGRVLWVHGIDTSFDPVFLLYTLKDRIMTDYGSIASGTTFAELKIFALKQCQVFDVPIEEQRSFAAFITQVDKSKFAIRKSLAETQSLFDSLMQKYFG